MKRRRIVLSTTLALALGLGVSQTSFAQSISIESLFAPFLEEFQQVFQTELTNLITSMQGDNPSPMTQSILNGIQSTLGAIGVPIPASLKQISQQSSAEQPDVLFLPYGDSQNLANFISANAVADQASNSVIGEAGQTEIQNILNASVDAGTAAVNIVQTEAGDSVAQVQSESESIQGATSSLDVLKGIARQNTFLAQLHQQLGTSQVELGQIGSMQANVSSKQLVLGAGQLQMEQLSANALSTLQNANQGQNSGAGGFLTTNAYQFICLSSLDCQ